MPTYILSENEKYVRVEDKVALLVAIDDIPDDCVAG